MNTFVSAIKTASLCLMLAFLLHGCEGCPPVTLKSTDLSPTNRPTGSSGTAGSVGYCLSAGNIPPSTFSAGSGQVMVGFDNYFEAGSDPFPCDDIRAIVFRGGLRFDLSQFDSIVSAELFFQTDSSVSRTGGATIGTIPGISHATTLGVATQAFSSKMLFDNDAPLAAGPNINVAVTGQVKDWVSNSRPNFGFVLAGPTGLVNSSNPPKNNDAKVSWYSSFRLRITYNPVQNPKAPQ